MRVVVVAIVALVGFASPASGQQGSAECQSAVDAYNAAVEEVSYRLRRYANCVSESRGLDDCYTEFRRLKSAQDDFEVAVSSYQSDCR